MSVLAEEASKLHIEENISPDASSQVPSFRISVRNIVEAVLRSGDIDNRFSGRDIDAMQEGARLHKKIQKSMGSAYLPEVFLKTTVMVTGPGQSLLLTVEGRADGIITGGVVSAGGADAKDNAAVGTAAGKSATCPDVCVDEIKCVAFDVDALEAPVPVHRAQAMCYAYIYAHDHGLDSIGIQMTYCSIETEKIKRFNESFSYEELEAFFLDLVSRQSVWLFFKLAWDEERNASIREMSFPFPYREGQRDLVAAILATFRKRGKIFIEAPTGVGKTISAVFPAVWQMGGGNVSKIFYLTAKTIARTVAEEAFAILAQRGMVFRPITLTAKEKLCILEKPDCNPVACPLAKGHFDRVNSAVYDLVTSGCAITREKILEYSERYGVCPFEMMLDASLWCDAVICDYNYCFDPNVYLKRFFGAERTELRPLNTPSQKSPGSKAPKETFPTDPGYVFLIDEAHNLVDRGREMYSAQLIKEDFLKAKKLCGDRYIYARLAKSLDAVNKALLKLKRECDEVEILESTDAVCLLLLRVSSEYESLNRSEQTGLGEEMRDLYLEIRHFLNMHETADEDYMAYTDFLEDRSFRIRLQCMRPANKLKAFLDANGCAAFYSATLLPISYYIDQLGGSSSDYAVYAPSPFPRENRLVMIGRDVSTKYTNRSRSEYEKILDYIIRFVSAKTGNYLVFFPSYRMMEEVAELDVDSGLNNLVMQKSHMTEAEKEDFLSIFANEPTETNVGFCVMGGVFSEGIDLREDRLIGTVIVGPGLPMVCNERELFRGFYDRKSSDGFNQAYLYPGMNKVLQAAGRVIRTMEDKGAILLLDQRFTDRAYSSLFPSEWSGCKVVTRDSMDGYLKEFWNRKETKESGSDKTEPT